MNTIGLDIGTSSVKALLVSPNGEILKVSCPEYPFQTPKPLWAETDPNVWWEATLIAIKELLEGNDPSSIGGIGLTGQMHGLVLLDSAGEVLRPCIMWNDQRSFAECDESKYCLSSTNSDSFDRLCCGIMVKSSPVRTNLLLDN